MVYKEGHSSYGHCWIEGDGVNFQVYVMDGRSSYGPYSSLADAISEFNRYCLQNIFFKENVDCKFMASDKNQKMLTYNRIFIMFYAV